MPEEANDRLEAWLDDGNRIVSFHEIPDSRYYSTDEPAFWLIDPYVRCESALRA